MDPERPTREELLAQIAELRAELTAVEAASVEMYEALDRSEADYEALFHAAGTTLTVVDEDHNWRVNQVEQDIPARTGQAIAAPNGAVGFPRCSYIERVLWLKVFHRSVRISGSSSSVTLSRWHK